LDSVIRRATVCCRRVGSITSTSPRALDPAGACLALDAGADGAERGDAATGAEREASAASMSSLTMRPPGPEPASVVRSMPFSSAIRRAIGEAFGRSPRSAAGAESGLGGAAVGGSGAATGFVPFSAGTASPGSPSQAITDPTGVVSFSRVTISITVPATSDS
jgi:hypothetical protein